MASNMVEVLTELDTALEDSLWNEVHDAPLDLATFRLMFELWEELHTDLKFHQERLQLARKLEVATALLRLLGIDNWNIPRPTN